MKARDNEGKNERDILLTLLPGLRGLHRHPQLSPTPKMLPVLSVGCGVGELRGGSGGCWGPAASSLPQPGLGRTTQRVISGQLCGYLPRRGGSRCPRHPKYHFENQSGDGKTNKIEIAQAASQRPSKAEIHRCRLGRGPGKRPADTLVGWGRVGRGGSHFPSCQPQAATVSPAPHRPPTAATATRPVTIQARPAQLFQASEQAQPPTSRQLGFCCPHFTRL